MNVIKDYRNWRNYRRTVNELKSLSDGTLKDIGVERGAISEYARRVSGY